MSNNRMLLICNVCVLPGAKDWPRYDDPALLHIAKWYPTSPWYSQHPESLGDRIGKFLEAHMHPEIHPAGEENPIRLEYEVWVRDMPAIKKWEYKPHKRYKLRNLVSRIPAFYKTVVRKLTRSDING